MLGLAVAALAGCSEDGGFPKVVVRLGAGGPTLGASTRTPLVVTDSAEADATAREIMAGNGTAADAAVAAAFMLASVLPSRAGLNARGSCLVQDDKLQDDKRARIEALDFSQADENAASSSVASPFVRAMFALHARYGTAPWARLIAPAEAAARFGVTVSAPLASDLREGQSLLSDGEALVSFTSPRRQLLTAGDTLKQPALADALDRLRLARAVGAAAWNGALPAVSDAPAPATSFVVTDGTMTVACVLSMGRRFGRGALKDGLLLAANDGALASPAIATDAHGRLLSAEAPGISGSNGIVCHDSDAGIHCDVRTTQP